MKGQVSFSVLLRKNEEMFLQRDTEKDTCFCEKFFEQNFLW